MQKDISSGATIKKTPYTQAGLVGLFFCLLYIAYQKTFITVDPYLWMPLVYELITPGLYSPNDLLISGGLKAPFHVYRIFAWICSFGIDPQHLFYICYVTTLWATFHFLWLIAYEITASTAISLIVLTCIVSGNPGNGTLNWTALPTGTFISSSVAQPLALLCLLWWLKGKHLWAIPLSSLVFNIHPGYGILCLSTSLFLTIAKDRTQKFSRIFPYILIAVAFTIPNILYMLNHVAENFFDLPSGVSNEEFFEIFKCYSVHTYLALHWKDGYALFFGLLGITLGILPNISPLLRQRIFLIILAQLLIILFYVVNLYLLEIRAVALTFLLRATFFLKPLFYSLTLGYFFNQSRKLESSENSSEYYIFPLLAVSLSNYFQSCAEFLTVITLGCYIISSNKSSRYIKLICISAISFITLLLIISERESFDYGKPASLIAISLLFGLIITTQNICTKTFGHSESDTKKHSATSMRNYFPLCILLFTVGSFPHNKSLLPASLKSIQLSMSLDHDEFKDTSDEYALILWAREKSRPRSLFALPFNHELAMTFRVRARRSVYASYADINQLAYSSAYYREAANRIQLIAGPQVETHRFSPQPCIHIANHSRAILENVEKIRELYRVDYIVLMNEQLETASYFPYPIVFKNNSFTVMDISPIDQDLARGEQG